MVKVFILYGGTAPIVARVPPPPTSSTYGGEVCANKLALVERKIITQSEAICIAHQGPGEKAEWRNGGIAEWRNGGIAEWRNSGIAEWRNRCMPPTRNRK